MRTSFGSWRWTLPALTVWASLWLTSAAQESQGLVQIAEPIAVSAAEPTPASQETSSVLSPAPEPAPARADEAGVETITERYPGGTIKIEREMIQDARGNYLLHGAWRHYDEQGRLVLDGRFERDQRVGPWRRFYRGDETKLLAAAPYKEFAAPFTSTATFQAGRLHGTWTIADSQQRKVHEIEHVAGERHGPATWYYPCGSVLMIANYEHGIPSGDVTKFGLDASVLARDNYQNGRKLGLKTEYHDPARQHKKHEFTYLHAALAVKTPDNWDTGALATFESRGQDERHGPYSVWHANGQLARQGEYRHDLPVGKVAAWYASGQKQLEGQYADGQQEGPWTWWHENGQKSAAGEFRGGVAIGSWSWWNNAGKIAQQSQLSGLTGETQPREALSEVREARIPHAEGSSLR